MNYKKLLLIMFCLPYGLAGSNKQKEHFVYIPCSDFKKTCMATGLISYFAGGACGLTCYEGGKLCCKTFPYTKKECVDCGFISCCCFATCCVTTLYSYKHYVEKKNTIHGK